MWTSALATGVVASGVSVATRPHSVLRRARTLVPLPPYTLPSRTRHCPHSLRAASREGMPSWSNESKTGKTQLPIFPLSLVAAPGGDVPLQIFEARYRVLFNTLLAGADDVDEGLVDEESPFKVCHWQLCYSLTSEQPV